MGLLLLWYDAQALGTNPRLWGKLAHIAILRKNRVCSSQRFLTLLKLSRSTLPNSRDSYVKKIAALKGCTLIRKIPAHFAEIEQKTWNKLNLLQLLALLKSLLKSVDASASAVVPCS